MTLSFIILTWNSKKYIKDCLQSYQEILDKEQIHAEFWIVDNGSADDTPGYVIEQIKPQFNYDLHIIQLERNYGTTKSRNIALKKATGKYIIICDSDTIFYQGSLRKAIMFYEANNTTGLIAPLLLWPDCKAQPSIRKFPTLADILLKILNLIFKLPAGEKDVYRELSWNQTIPVETAASAFWIFKRNLLDSIGLLDENIFYAPEDIDYCLRIWINGQRVIFYPELKIIHYAQRISRTNPFSKIARSHFSGLLYFFRKHNYLFSRTKLMQQYDISCK